MRLIIVITEIAKIIIMLYNDYGQWSKLSNNVFFLYNEYTCFYIRTSKLWLRLEVLFTGTAKQVNVLKYPCTAPPFFHSSAVDHTI